jgi:hypothetical protein
MPKIPRSRDNVVRYQPSAAPEIPMGLADYSAMTNALSEGAKYAAQRHHQKVDEEAKLTINAYSNDLDEALQAYSLTPYETSSLQKGGKPLSLKEKSEQRDADFKKIVDDLTPSEDMQGYWQPRHRIALEAARDNAMTLNATKTRLLESQTLVSAHKANYDKWEEKTLTNIRDINTPIDSIFRGIRDSWDLRLKDASAGGLMENPKQVQAAKVAFSARMVPALFERYEGTWISKMDDGSIRTTSDLESPITDSMSDSERKAAGIYGSYMEFYRDVKNNGLIAGYNLNELSPDKGNLQLAQESHDRIFGRITKNRTARRTAATANFNTVFNGYMDRATNEQRDFNEIEMNHIKASANAAGVRLSSHFFNFRKNAQSKPTLAQEHNNSLLEYEFEKIKTDALNRDVEPDFTAFTLRVVKEYDAGMLHVSDMQSAFKELGAARTAKGKRINEDVKTITDLFMKQYVPVSKIGSTGKKRLSKGPKSINELGFYEGYNAEMTGDIRPAIRAAVMRAHASGKTVEPQTIYNEVVSHIRQVQKNMDPLKINISQEELEPILQKRQEGGTLDDDEQLIYDLSLTKMGRNSRFKRAAKKFMASASSLSGASLADKKKFSLEYKDELSFLMPGGYDIEALHNKYRRRVDFAKPKEVTGTTAQPKEVTGDQSGDTKLPVPEDTGEKSYEEMDIAELMSAFKENPAKVWKDLPDEFKEKMKPHLGLLGLKEDENGNVVADVEEIKVEKQPPRPSPHDETKVRTLSKSGKFETKKERGQSAKDEKIGKSAIATVIKGAKNVLSSAKENIDAFRASGDKAGKSIDEYKANLEKKWGSPVPQIQEWVGQLYAAGENVLAEELEGVLALLSGDSEVGPPDVIEEPADYSAFEKEYGYLPDALFNPDSINDYDYPFEFLLEKLDEYEGLPSKDATDKKTIKLLRRKIKAETGE